MTAWCVMVVVSASCSGCDGCGVCAGCSVCDDYGVGVMVVV